MHARKSTIFSALLAIVVALPMPESAGADQSCPRIAGVNGPVYAKSSCAAAAYQGAAAQYRLAEDPQYRFANDPQYHLAHHAQDRLVETSQYRMDHLGQQAASGSAQFQPAPSAQRSAAAANAARASRYSAIIWTAAHAEGIEPELLHAVVAVESGYDPAMRSQKGAVGLMQLMPGTAARYGVTNPRDPSQNLNAGARHLRYLLGRFDNDVKLALAAYNAGEQAVWQHGNRIPPYPETRAYVRRVLASYHQYVLSSLLHESL